MEIVINIPEELYEAYKGRSPMLGDAGMDMIAQAIANGTPLPKGHDRLVEPRAVIKALFGKQTIDDVPTIIEADKGCDYENT